MRILVTGSSGWLGQTLVPRLGREGHQVVGLDIRPGAHTSVVGSVVDRALINDVMSAEAITAIVHSAALHKPDIMHYPPLDFVSVNVQGTLNLLEAAVAAHVERFVFTSTTSLMVSALVRAGIDGGAKQAVWITEDMPLLEPRNIYGVTKLAAEHLCRITFQDRRLPVVGLPTSRFFPDAEDMARAIKQ